jgi:hypothetical protein
VNEPPRIVESVHLVGSVPLESAAAVFRAVSDVLGPRLPRIPDGETGERTGWVGCQVPVFLAHPAFEIEPSEQEGERAEDLEAAGRAEGEGYKRPVFRLRDGADAAALAFDDLGYAAAALASYATFAELKRAGTIRPGTRFQVSLPTPLAPLAIFVTPGDVGAVLPAYRSAMLREVAEICAAVPTGELALQWDVAPEMGLLEGVFPAPFADVEATVAASLVALGDAVPPEVSLGYHLCYGDFGHAHFVEPRDMTVLVDLTNRVAAGLSRSLDWVHMPVPRDRDDAEYFAPLDGLRLAPGTELYLGLVHATDGADGARRRIAAAAKFRGDFGVGTECGFGRRDPASIPALLALHGEVAAAR